MNHDNQNELLKDLIKSENSENDSKSVVQCYFCDLVLKNSEIESHINEKHGENKPVIFLSVNKKDI